MIPPVLFEGDVSEVPGPAGPGKFELGASLPAAPGPQLERLPEAYGTGHLLLMRRDPHCLYAHWDLSYEQMQRFNAQSREQHLILRIHVEGQPTPLREIHVHADSRHWFIQVGHIAASYRVELGYYEPSGEWRTVLSSEPISPSTRLRAAEKAPGAATIHFEKPASLPEGSQGGGVVSIGPGSPAHVPVGSEPPPPFVARPPIQVENFAARIAKPSFTIKEGSLSEKGISERGNEGTARPNQVTEVAVKEPSDLSSPSSLEIERPLNISSRMEAGPPEQKGFWLSLNAELIIYGATAPDALLFIHDQPVPTRADGTFSFRLALPDGQHTLPIIAVSQQGETRGAVLSFSRATEHQGEVQAHPGTHSSPGQ